MEQTTANPMSSSVAETSAVLSENLTAIARVTKVFRFSAGHYLTGHKTCGNVHGHNYKLFITVRGKIDPQSGFVMDFYFLKQIVENNVLCLVDHPQILLNQIIGVEPTCENLAVWVWNRLWSPLKIAGVSLDKIRIFETDDSYCDYYGEKF